MTLETKRLILRPFSEQDAPFLYELNKDAYVMKFTGDTPFLNEAEALEFIRNYDHYSCYGYGRWTVVIMETKEVIGWCGLKYHDEGYIDIGFRLFRRHWGKGYATEAAKVSVIYGKETLKLSPIWGRVAKDNVASIRVLEKIGMKYFKSDSCDGIKDALFYR